MSVARMQLFVTPLFSQPRSMACKPLALVRTAEMLVSEARPALVAGLESVQCQLWQNAVKVGDQKPIAGLPGRRSDAIGDTDTFLVLSRAFANCSFELLLLPFLHFLSSSYSVFFFKTHKRRYSHCTSGKTRVRARFSSVFERYHVLAG